MKCQVCGRAIPVGQELLYKIKGRYYCPYCFERIAERPKKTRQKGKSPEPRILRGGKYD